MNAMHVAKGIDEGSCRMGIHTVKEVPNRVGAFEILGPNRGHLFFGGRKAHNRETVLLVDSGFFQLPEKGNVAVSVQRIDHDPTVRKSRSNGLHHGRDIAAAQGQVDFADDLGSARGRLRADDRVGGAGIDIVGAYKEERLTPVLE